MVSGSAVVFLEKMAKARMANSPFPKMSKIVKPGVSGDCEIRIVKLTSDGIALDNMRFARDGRMEFLCCPGEFAVLSIGGVVMMSDTPMERITNLELIREARGEVLVAGLGIGMVVHALASKREVDHVHVVEINRNVISLVSGTIPEKKVSIVEGDVMEFIHRVRSLKPTPRWDTIYIDIWPSIDADDCEQVSELKRLSRKILSKGGWIGAWGDSMRARERRETPKYNQWLPA